jgi:RNA polymerase sigma factor (TIGR02999 family)
VETIFTSRGDVSESRDITQALTDLTGGDQEALDRLLPVVYQHLRGIAQRKLRRERPDHTLNATALVHEAYLRLVQLDHIDWEGRAHFFGAAARAWLNRELAT